MNPLADLRFARAQPRVVHDTGHRPWPLPDAPWIMGQTWVDLLFAHWPVDPALLRPVVHPSIPLDTREGQAWITITPFEVRGLRPRFLTPLPGISAFPELNVRTYATIDGKPGIYFFNLDAADWLPVWAARRAYRLPYFKADMSIRRYGKRVRYRDRRTHGPPGEFEASYGPAGPVQNAAPDSLDYWLDERYCLYTTDASGRPLRGQIHHKPWPLQPASATLDRNTIAQHAGVELESEPPARLHYAARQDVIFWPLEPA